MLGITYKVRLQKKEYVGADAMAFYFDKPYDFSFKPGQYVDATLMNSGQTDADGNIRSFSIASAPADEYLMLATRVRDTAFKRGLAAIPLNAEIEFEGPFGYFTLHHNPMKPAVFLAAGLGITPFSSMVRHAARQKLSQQSYLFYANGRPEDAIFLSTLQEIEKENPNFRLIPTMTHMDDSRQTWSGETGPVNEEMLSRYVPRLRGPIYYVAGPPAMVSSTRAMLADAGVNEDDVTTEEFVGY